MDSPLDVGEIAKRFTIRIFRASVNTIALLMHQAMCRFSQMNVRFC